MGFDVIVERSLPMRSRLAVSTIRAPILMETHPQGRELGAGRRLRLGDGVAQSEHQPGGPGMQHEPHLVGER